jgi:hypothetical protein
MISLQIYGACGTYRAKIDAPSVLLWKPEDKRPFGRTRRRWEDNIKMNLQ